MAYSYKRALTIDHTQCGTVDSGNFPVLVRITDATLKTVANSGHVQNASGYDIGFFSDWHLAHPLFWEVESYDGATGTLIAWVNVSNVSATVDVAFFIAYGDSGISTFQSTASSVWNANFKAVWHLGGSGPSMNDSTTSGLTFTTNTGVAATGNIDGGSLYAGGGSSLVDGTPVNFAKTSPKSFSMWVYPTSTLDRQTLYWKGDSFHWITLYLSGDLFVQFDGTFTFITLSVKWTVNAWNHIFVTTPGSGGTGNAYVNGQASGTFPNGTSDQTASSISIGVTNVSQLPLSGTLDEVKVSNVVRPLSWILAEYNNQVAGSTFLSVSAENPPATDFVATISHLFGFFDMGDFRI